MSYTKTNWTNNSAPAINADNLNKIEQGIYDNDAAIASANTNIGTLTNLTTTEKSNLVGAINEVNSNTETNMTNIGDLSDLETTTQTDIVSAINEVDSHADTNTTNIGDLTTLTTTADADLVSAINELDDLKATKDVATTSVNGLMSANDKTKLDNIEVTQSTGISVASQYITQGAISAYEYGKMVIILIDIRVTTDIPANTPFATGIPLPIANTQGTINGPGGLAQGIVARRANTQTLPRQTLYSASGMQAGFYNGQITYFKE